MDFFYFFLRYVFNTFLILQQVVGELETILIQFLQQPAGEFKKYLQERKNDFSTNENSCISTVFICIAYPINPINPLPITHKYFKLHFIFQQNQNTNRKFLYFCVFEFQFISKPNKKRSYIYGKSQKSSFTPCRRNKI